MDRNAIRQVRTFNRMMAERIGAVGNRFLGRFRPMGESRLLWEIGLDGCEMRVLRRRLGLDSGYVSRTLSSLQREGLVSIGMNLEDQRARRVRLTEKGQAEWEQLDRRSDVVASSFLEPLSAEQQGRLVAAMAEVEKLLQASTVQVEAVHPSAPAARACIAQYTAELNARFEDGFDPTRNGSTSVFELMPPSGVLLLASLHDKPVGCGALTLHPGAPAKIKRMWVTPELRGVGIGRRLLQELESYAQEAGARSVRLETNRALQQAIGLYRASGYQEVAAFSDEPYAQHWFQKSLVGGPRP